MFNQNNALPISGGVVVAGLLYAGAALFVFGPLVAERTIAKSGWAAHCQATLQARIEAQRTPTKVIPKLDCRSTLGAFLPELAQLCNQYGNPNFGGGAANMLREQERLRKEAENRRLAQAAAGSGSQCACAASVTAQNPAWAWHAGSFRLITPPQVNHLSSELMSALNAPSCQGRRVNT